MCKILLHRKQHIEIIRMRKYFHCFATALFFIFITPTLVNAANIRCGSLIQEFSHQENKIVREIHLSGLIADGDVDKATENLATCNTNQNFDVTRFVLSSSGGSLREGIRLGRFFNSNAIGTLVAAKTSCLSSCAVAFMGGVLHADWGNKALPHTWRTIAPDAILGFHAPFLPANLYSAIPNKSESILFDKIYSSALTTAAELLLFSTEVDWPTELMQRMLDTKSGQFVFVKTVRDLGKWNIDLYDNDEPVFYTIRELITACKNYTNGWNTYSETTSQNLNQEDISFSYFREDLIFEYLKDDLAWGCSLEFYGQVYSAPFGIMQRRLSHYVNMSAATQPADTAIGDLPLIWKKRQSIKLPTTVGTNIWKHQGSTVSLKYGSYGPVREIIIRYDNPKSDLRKIGVTKGMILFRGLSYGLNVAGISYFYTNECGARSITTSGTFDIGENKLTLSGSTLPTGKLCEITNYNPDVATNFMLLYQME